MDPSDDDLPGGLVLAGGHESASGRELPRLPSGTPLARLPVRAVGGGRALAHALAEVAEEAAPDRCVVVLPMTLGRDPRLISDTARTVRWAARGQAAGRYALAPPFGTPDHLVGWLRGACRRLSDDEAALVAAPAADPFDDAELHRVVALVRAYGTGRLVEVGLRSPSGGLEQGLDRCRRLGATRIAVVSAAFGAPPDVDQPLLAPAATASVVWARVATACHRLAAHGDDGIANGVAADHHHGFAHSHEHAHSHDHHHVHPQEQTWTDSSSPRATSSSTPVAARTG